MSTVNSIVSIRIVSPLWRLIGGSPALCTFVHLAATGPGVVSGALDDPIIHLAGWMIGILFGSREMTKGLIAHRELILSHALDLNLRRTISVNHREKRMLRWDCLAAVQDLRTKQGKSESWRRV